MQHAALLPLGAARLCGGACGLRRLGTSAPKAALHFLRAGAHLEARRLPPSRSRLRRLAAAGGTLLLTEAGGWADAPFSRSGGASQSLSLPACTALLSVPENRDTARCTCSAPQVLRRASSLKRVPKRVPSSGCAFAHVLAVSRRCAHFKAERIRIRDTVCLWTGMHLKWLI